MNAMVPELTTDYDERTELFNWMVTRRHKSKKPMMIGLSLPSIAANAGPATLRTLGWFAEPGGTCSFPS